MTDYIHFITTMMTSVFIPVFTGVVTALVLLAIFLYGVYRIYDAIMFNIWLRNIKEDK